MTKYLQKATVRTGQPFHAQFTNGTTTDSHDVACYFLIMQEKAVRPADLGSHIRIGEMMDPSHDWKEIRRIAATFNNVKGEAA